MDRAQLIKALRDTAQSASNAIAGSVSGPVDLITAALRAGGLNIERPIGGSEWMNEKGLTIPVEMGAPRIVGETLGIAGPAVVAAKAPQIASAINRGVQNLAAGGAPAMRGQMGGVYMGGPRQEALETAQRNAAKPVSEGGLGLPPNNTPMDRAKALGFADDVYHSSLGDVVAFKPHNLFAGHQGVSGVSVTDSPEMASRYLDRYANYGWVNGVPNQPFSKNVMPLLIRKGNALEVDVSPYKGRTGAPLGAPLPANYRNPMIDDGIDTLVVPDAISRRGVVKHSDAKNAIRGNELIVASPAQLRSRFAAFDPARVNENDLLGRADPRLLGLMGLGAAGGLGAYNYMQGQ